MAEPWNANTVSDSEVSDLGPDRCDAADDLMAGNDRQARVGEIAVDHV
jgi:hypothetical protein